MAHAGTSPVSCIILDRLTRACLDQNLCRLMDREWSYSPDVVEYLQEWVVAVMLAAKDSLSSSDTPGFFLVWANDTTVFSVVEERSWNRNNFPWRKRSSVLSKVSFRWFADIHWELPARHAEILSLFEIREKTELASWWKEQCDLV